MTIQSQPLQLADDQELLHLMLRDAIEGQEIYKANSYWSGYTREISKYLENQGLHDFRRIHGTLLSTIASIDRYALPPKIEFLKRHPMMRRLFANRFTAKIPLWKRFQKLQNALLNKLLSVTTAYNIEINGLRDMAFEFSQMLGELAGARPLDELEASVVGNPQGLFRKGSNDYSIQILEYYLRYAYCCNYINFNEVDVIVELGGGFGLQVEVIKKLHPHICFLLFDLAPQSYLTERYLTTIFPESVVSYRETRDMDSIPTSHEGKIFVFGNWKFPIVESANTSLFWTAVSLQEMDRDVSANYLDYVNRNANSAYLHQRMQGKMIRRSVFGPTLNQYKTSLSNLELTDLSQGRTPFGRMVGENNYSDSFWKKATV